MKSRIILLCLLSLGTAAKALAQEANSGFELGMTLSGEALYSRQLASPPRNGDDVTGAFRAVLYPTWKVSQHWTFSGAVEAYSHPYFFRGFFQHNNRHERTNPSRRRELLSILGE